jgi:hypothetical protein
MFKSSAHRTAPTIEQVAPRLRAFCAARDDIEAAWVFGSVARGTARADSDVDIAILPPSNHSAEERWALKLDLAFHLPDALGVRDVDVMVAPEAGVLLAHRALVEGERVYGDASRAAAEAEIAAMREYVDFEWVLRLMEQRLSERLDPYSAE